MGELVSLFPPAPAQWELFVPGAPKTTQTGTVRKLANGRRMPGRRHTGWCQVIAEAAQVRPPRLMFTGALAVALRFYRTRPKGTPRWVEYPETKPDVVNLGLGLTNALNGIVWDDDARIVSFLQEKFFALPGDLPGVLIQVRAL